LDEGLGFPGYRVYKHEIDEQRKHVTLWIRRKRGNQNLRCPGCGRRVGEIHEVIERTVRDLPCFEYTTTVIVELYRLRCPNCGVKTEQMPQLPSKAPYRIKAAKFPVSKSLETYNFLDMPTLNKKLVIDLARCEWIGRRENVLALGNSGTGKTHISLALGLAACQQGFRVRFTTAAALVHELIEARDEKRLLRFQKNLCRQELLIVDELGFVPLSKAGAEMLFEILSQRYERSSTLVTSNLPFAEWTEVLGSERLTGALLDRLTHHVHILEMNGESYRLKNSKKKKDPGPQ
jgi:DNA replication protein DnaC